LIKKPGCGLEEFFEIFIRFMPGYNRVAGEPLVRCRGGLEEKSIIVGRAGKRCFTRSLNTRSRGLAEFLWNFVWAVCGGPAV
jgi:hypothetical protein